jgi:hypothetical protein
MQDRSLLIQVGAVKAPRPEKGKSPRELFSPTAICHAGPRPGFFLIWYVRAGGWPASS